jgi:ferredoxin-thioredoxin reductase catalytic subunit
VHGKLQQAFVCGEYHPNVIHEGGACYCNLSFEHKNEVVQYCKIIQKSSMKVGFCFFNNLS